jgi:DNA-binding MarR family transcriptional regulator
MVSRTKSNYDLKMPETSRAATPPVVDALVQVTFAVLDVLVRSAAEHELSLTQFRLLGILRDRAPSMATIADFLGLDRSSVSGLIDRAERRGLVARRTSSEDARVTIVDLTDAGLAVAERGAITLTTELERILADVPDGDRAEFARIAETIADASRTRL